MASLLFSAVSYIFSFESMLLSFLFRIFAVSKENKVAKWMKKLF